MKKLTLITAALFLSAILIGQTSKGIRHLIDNIKKYEQFSTNTSSNLIIKQKLDSAINIEWNDEASQWENSTKESFAYNEQGENIQYINCEWNESSSQWRNSWKVETGFDDSGNMLFFEFYGWDGQTNQWEGDFKEENTYDASGNIIVQIFYEWDDGSNQWEKGGKDELTYDTSGNLILSMEYDWDELTSQWIVEGKSEFTYDQYGNQTKINYYWDEINNQWIFTNKIERTFNENGNIIMEVGYSWENNQWQKSEKYEFLFNTNYTLSTESGFFWDGSQWIMNSFDELTYDELWNLILSVNSYLNESTNEMEYSSKNEYAYNNSYTFDELVLPWIFNYYLEGNIFYHMLIGGNEYVYQDDNWLESVQSTWYYSEIDIDIVPNHSASETIIFPNPFDESIVIEFELLDECDITLTIYNLLGQKAATIFNGEKVKGNHQLSWDSESMSPGIYFMKFRLDNETTTYKLIKR